MTDWADVEGLVEAALTHFGRIDAVFANAGFGADARVPRGEPEHWRAMVVTNVLGVALTIRATLPHLLDADTRPLRDHRLGRRPARAPGLALLGDEVGGDARSREALRQELRQMHDNDSIRVTLIEPGMVDTPFFDNRPGDRARSPPTTSPAR